MLRSFKIALVAASLFVGGTAFADRAKDGDAGKPNLERRAKRMAKFDLDHDGKLDHAERAAMMKAKFARLDKNHDGVLSFDEAQGLLHRGGVHQRGMGKGKGGDRARGERGPRGPRGDRGSDHRPDRPE